MQLNIEALGEIIDSTRFQDVKTFGFLVFTIIYAYKKLALISTWLLYASKYDKYKLQLITSLSVKNILKIKIANSF